MNHLMASPRAGETLAEGDFFVTFCREAEKLVRDFVAALFAIKVGRFNGRTFVFDEAISAGCFTPLRKNVVTKRAIFRKEIAEAFDCLECGHGKAISHAPQDPRNQIDCRSSTGQGDEVIETIC